MSYLQEYLKGNTSMEQQGNHSVYWMPVSVFTHLPIKRWKHNRPEDPIRIAEIREWISTSKRLDGVIYLACIDNELVCYESNHRREALKGIEGVYNIFVDVLWNAKDEDVKKEFLRLNKAVSVPELYISDEPIVGISELKHFVDTFCSNYKKLQVSTNRPQRPNFNRDMLTEEFYRILKEQKWNLDELAIRITNLNREMSLREKSRLSAKVIQKCEESGLWLFAWSSKIEL
jgi:hypothetical protein